MSMKHGTEFAAVRRLGEQGRMGGSAVHGANARALKSQDGFDVASFRKALSLQFFLLACTAIDRNALCPDHRLPQNYWSPPA